MAKSKKQQTTRDTDFNYNKDVDTKTIDALVSYNATKNFKNIRLLNVNDGVSISGLKIKEHAENNRTMADLGDTSAKINTDNIESTENYRIYGAPFQVTLNNRQHYNNCGVESTLNTLAMAGIVKMKDNLSDQNKIENSFLKTVWELGLVGDDGAIGVLDEPDGGTLPDDYKDILRQFGIDSEAYYISRKCDGTQFSDINELAYKISQGHGAVLGVCAGRLWQETEAKPKDIAINHAVAITGVVYKDGVDPTETNPDGTYKNAPAGFYIHDSGAWMSRYISLEEFKYVTLYAEHGMLESDKAKYANYDDTTYDYTKESYRANLREFDSELRTFIGKQPNGIFVTITDEPIKSEMFNLNATGDNSNNKIWGNNNDNVIKGMGGNDIMYGNAGNDEIRGGKGHDIIIGNNIYTEYQSFLQDFGFNLDYFDLSDKNQAGNNILYGDAGNDTIIGGDDIDLVYGGDGNDLIWSGDGRNAVYGGKGNDFVIGGWDNDRLFGDAGNDVIYGLIDSDTINGGAGNDTIYGGTGDDRIETGKGTDTVVFEGTQHGKDVVSSESGKTIFAFTDEENYGNTYYKGAEILDMYFSLNTDGNNLYNFEIKYSDVNDDDVTDGIKFNDFYNAKNGKYKSLDLIDADNETYRVSVSKSNNAKVANTTKTSNINNVLFTTYDKGTKITTSTKNDVVTMMETKNPFNFNLKSETVYDTIHYTGGTDKYISEERNTRYYVDTFNLNTELAIYDNVKSIEKYSLDSLITPSISNVDSIKIAKENVVSTDDRLYISTGKGNINFLFDVGLDNSNNAITTQNHGLFILSNSGDFKNVAEGVINKNADNELAGACIYLDSFFGYDINNETQDVIGKNFDGNSNFYGNGRIESINYGTGTNYDNYTAFATDFTQYVANIASSVAGWLSNDSYNVGNYDSAFKAFDNFDNLSTAAQTALVNCYTQTLSV